MNCGRCNSLITPDFKFCPYCGTNLPTSAKSQNRSIPARFIPVISEYENLTRTKLSESQKLRFIELPPIGQLSVNTSDRRIAAAKKILKSNGDGTYSLDVLDWAKSMYEIKDKHAISEVRVWITPGGDKYHSSRDCKALASGQSFAGWKGKEIYKPEYVTLRHAAWILGKNPCQVCKPRKWN